MANAVPDSRTPRRFIAVRNTTARTAIKTSCPRVAGSTVAMYCEAEEIDTATVST
jgi:hypothetical protein